MITVELDNITSLMPRKPVVCLLSAVLGKLQSILSLTNGGGFQLPGALVGRIWILQTGKGVGTLGPCR